MERPDLLVVDLDGTLLNREGAVSDENAAAMERAWAAELPLIVATGRTASECQHVLQQLPALPAMIGASGALLTDLDTMQTIDRRALSADMVQQVFDTCPVEGAAMFLLKDRHETNLDYIVIGQADLHPVSEWWFQVTGARWSRVAHLEDDPHPTHTVRVGAVGTPDQFDSVVQEMQRSMGESVTARHWEAVTSSQHAGEPIHLLEVFHPEADKWTMIQSWCTRMDLSADRAAAVGDGLNDVMMIEQCGLGVAMANADHRVLAVADTVTGDHHDHGVADLIDDLLAGRVHLQSSEPAP